MLESIILLSKLTFVVVSDSLTFDHTHKYHTDAHPSSRSMPDSSSSDDCKYSVGYREAGLAYPPKPWVWGYGMDQYCVEVPGSLWIFVERWERRHRFRTRCWYRLRRLTMMLLYLYLPERRGEQAGKRDLKYWSSCL